MLEAVDKFARVFGACVILVSLCSGCASRGTPSATVMTHEQLRYFQIDCKIKNQQMAMLESMRLTPDEQFIASMKEINPFEPRTSNINRSIDWHQHMLAYCDRHL